MAMMPPIPPLRVLRLLVPRRPIMRGGLNQRSAGRGAVWTWLTRILPCQDGDDPNLPRFGQAGVRPFARGRGMRPVRRMGVDERLGDLILIFSIIAAAGRRPAVRLFRTPIMLIISIYQELSQCC